MESIELKTAHERIALCHNGYRAEFIHTEEGWYPDWIYLDNKPILRLKDHEWLSIGHLRSPAQSYREIHHDRETGFEFLGTTDYAGVPVRWSVRITAAEGEPWYHIHTEILPEDTVELMEAFTSVEIPYAYSGMEDALCMVGQNPVTHWKDGKAIAEERYWLPQWVLTRPDSARNLIPSKTPVVCLRVREKPEDMPLWVSVVGDWNWCDFHSLFMTPTSFVGGARGYKLMAGTHNWSSAIAKDPNVLFEKGRAYRQDFYVHAAYSTDHADVWYHRAFMKAVALHFPQDGVVPSYERAKAKHALMGDGCRWLLDTYNAPGKEGLYDPEKGILVYLAGTRPKTGVWYKSSLAQLIGPIGYHHAITQEPGGNAFCLRHEEEVRGLIATSFQDLSNTAILTIPAMYYFGLTRNPADREACLAFARDAIRTIVPSKNPSDVGDPGSYYRNGADNGFFGLAAEGLLKAHEIIREPWILEGALSILRRLNADLDHRFWLFGCSPVARDTQAGGQIRPLGMGHAIMANVLAYEATRDEVYLNAAERLAKFLVSICYSVYSDSPDPDFDYRGWANGANSGRDLTAEYPPWETSESMLCASYLLQYRIVPGVLHVLWYLQRTYPAAFPAARELKKYYDCHEKPFFRRMDEVASEREVGQKYPFLTYECPYDQTLQSCYQGVNPILNHLAFCGGLVEPSDERLLAVVPSAQGYDPAQRRVRRALLFNPLAFDIETALRVKHMDSGPYTVTYAGNQLTLTYESLANRRFTVPAHGVTDITITIE